MEVIVEFVEQPLFNILQGVSIGSRCTNSIGLQLMIQPFVENILSCSVRIHAEGSGQSKS